MIEEYMVGLLIFGPAALGLGALVAAIMLFRRAKTSSSPGFLRFAGVLCLIAALGVGSCYGMMFLS